MSDIGLPSGKSLFQLQAERILCVQRLAAQSTNEGKVILHSVCLYFIWHAALIILLLAGSGGFVPIHWYIMTSPFTDDVTRKFFESHKYFGLEADQVRCFNTLIFVIIVSSWFLVFFLTLQCVLLSLILYFILFYLFYYWCRSPSSSKEPYLVFQRMADSSWRLPTK